MRKTFEVMAGIAWLCALACIPYVGWLLALLYLSYWLSGSFEDRRV